MFFNIHYCLRQLPHLFIFLLLQYLLFTYWWKVAQQEEAPLLLTKPNPSPLLHVFDDQLWSEAFQTNPTTTTTINNNITITTKAPAPKQWLSASLGAQQMIMAKDVNDIENKPPLTLLHPGLWYDLNLTANLSAAGEPLHLLQVSVDVRVSLRPDSDTDETTTALWEMWSDVHPFQQPFELENLVPNRTRQKPWAQTPPPPSSSPTRPDNPGPKIGYSPKAAPEARFVWLPSESSEPLSLQVRLNALSDQWPFGYAFEDDIEPLLVLRIRVVSVATKQTQSVFVLLKVKWLTLKSPMVSKHYVPSATPFQWYNGHNLARSPVPVPQPSVSDDLPFAARYRHLARPIVSSSAQKPRIERPAVERHYGDIRYSLYSKPEHFVSGLNARTEQHFGQVVHLDRPLALTIVAQPAFNLHLTPHGQLFTRLRVDPEHRRFTDAELQQLLDNGTTALLRPLLDSSDIGEQVVDIRLQAPNTLDILWMTTKHVDTENLFTLVVWIEALGALPPSMRSSSGLFRLHIDTQVRFNDTDHTDLVYHADEAVIRLWPVASPPPPASSTTTTTTKPDQSPEPDQRDQLQHLMRVHCGVVSFFGLSSAKHHSINAPPPPTTRQWWTRPRVLYMYAFRGFYWLVVLLDMSEILIRCIETRQLMHLLHVIRLLTGAVYLSQAPWLPFIPMHQAELLNGAYFFCWTRRWQLYTRRPLYHDSVTLAMIMSVIFMAFVTTNSVLIAIAMMAVLLAVDARRAPGTAELPMLIKVVAPAFLLSGILAFNENGE